MTHTPEPWSEDGYDVLGANDMSVFCVPESLIGEDDLARLIACVNACAGIPTDKLTPGVVKRLIEAARNVERESSRQTVKYIELRSTHRELGSE